VWSVNAFSRPPYGAVLLLEARGERDGRPLSVRVALRHPDAYEFTAIPVAACLRQYLDGSIARPGLWLMGEVVEAARLFQDMERMGVGVETTVAAVAPKDIRPVKGAVPDGVRGEVSSWNHSAS